jgi:hypothetical protein
MGFFWFLRNYYTEGRHWLHWILSLESLGDTSSAARCPGCVGFLDGSMGEGSLGLSLCDRGIARAPRTGDPFAVAWAFYCRCGTHFVLGDARSTEQDARAGMARSAEAGWRWGEVLCSAWLGRSLLMQRRIDEAVQHRGSTLEIARAVGDPFSAALTMSFYAAALGAQGDNGRASGWLAKSLDLFREVGSFAQLSRLLVDWATLAICAGNVTDAASALRDGLSMAAQLGHVPYRFAQLFTVAAHIALALERFVEAAQFVATARALRAQSSTRVAAEDQAEELTLLASIGQHLGISSCSDCWRQMKPCPWQTPPLSPTRSSPRAAAKFAG